MIHDFKSLLFYKWVNGCLSHLYASRQNVLPHQCSLTFGRVTCLTGSAAADVAHRQFGSSGGSSLALFVALGVENLLAAHITQACSTESFRPVLTVLVKSLP